MSDPTRIVADADVLAADLLVGGPAREALDHVRSHSWLELLTSESLLADLEAVVAALADGDLARAHRETVAARSTRVTHPDADHPALATAYRGGAAHVLSWDDRIGSVATGLALQPRLSVSVRTPAAFVAVFDPASLFVATHEGSYPGPDRDPRR